MGKAGRCWLFPWPLDNSLPGFRKGLQGTRVPWAAGTLAAGRVPGGQALLGHPSQWGNLIPARVRAGTRCGWAADLALGAEAKTSPLCCLVCPTAWEELREDPATLWPPVWPQNTVQHAVAWCPASTLGCPRLSSTWAIATSLYPPVLLPGNERLSPPQGQETGGRSASLGLLGGTLRHHPHLPPCVWRGLSPVSCTH